MGEALGRSQVGFSTKLHLRAEGEGKPMAAVLTAGERHEQFALDALMDILRDCREFRVGAAIVDPTEVPDGTTQSAPHP